ncbi:hypothetical protein Scep_026235 [Stephania cephalantha]|uniref:Uncharacterized protein n=1 Tax=Stephania cephalantha TaxID=152367 RepID=A0AAP0EJS5_9MAGN
MHPILGRIPHRDTPRVERHRFPPHRQVLPLNSHVLAFHVCCFEEKKSWDFELLGQFMCVLEERLFLS